MKIRKILVAVISLFMAAALLTGCGTANSGSKADDLPVIRLGSDSYPPYNYLDEDGNPTGIDVELATEAFARMGYRVEIVQIDWEKKKEDSKLEFKIPQKNDKNVKQEIEEAEILEEAEEMLSVREIVNATSSYKTDFMYSVLLNKKEKDVLPSYIEEGLKWLTE